MAWRQSPGGSEQHLTRAAAAARTRTQRPGKHLAVHASELVVKPDFQIHRRYRRPLLLRLEHTHRPTLEDYVHRATRLGSSRSLNLRIGVTCWPATVTREAGIEAGQNHNPWPKDRRYVYRRVQDCRRRGARVLSAKGKRDCRPGVLPRQDALRARGAGCPTDHFKNLSLARAPRSEQYRVTYAPRAGSQHRQRSRA